MHGSIHLGKIAGISIDLHFTWFIIFALVAFMVISLLPKTGIEPGARWALGIGVALVFFVSLLLHELAHSLVAKRLGIGISGITLFVFGGVSRMTSEPKTAGDELKMAIVGPLTSAVLGVAFLFGMWAVKASGGNAALREGLFWLGWINLALAAFNLVPGFPLDGGRVLRAIVWGVTNDLQHATYIASTAGRGFGYLLMAVGVFELFTRFGLNGLWLILVGWFLLDAARSSYQQQVLQSALSGVRVRDIMTPNVVTISPDTTLQDAVDQYFLRLNHAAFPVAEDHTIRGILTLPHVRQVPRDRWPHTRASDVVDPIDNSDLMRPDADAWDALTAMATKDSGRLLVVDGGVLVGIISRTDIMRFLRTRMTLQT
jgi:Zn-dependent protease/CBS domain-containing protein